MKEFGKRLSEVFKETPGTVRDVWNFWTTGVDRKTYQALVEVISESVGQLWEKSDFDWAELGRVLQLGELRKAHLLPSESSIPSMKARVGFPMFPADSSKKFDVLSLEKGIFKAVGRREGDGVAPLYFGLGPEVHLLYMTPLFLNDPSQVAPYLSAGLFEGDRVIVKAIPDSKQEKTSQLGIIAARVLPRYTGMISYKKLIYQAFPRFDLTISGNGLSAFVSTQRPVN